MMSRMNFEGLQVRRGHEGNEHGVEARGGAQVLSDAGTWGVQVKAHHAVYALSTYTITIIVRGITVALFVNA